MVLIDIYLLNYLAGIRTGFFNSFFLFVNTYFNYYFLALVVTLIPFLKKNYKEILARLWSAFLITGAAVFVLKKVIARPRPSLSLITETSYSFPSGHATIMFAILPIIWVYFKNLRIIWLVASLIIAFSRLYLGAHYFTDVISGIIFGLGIGFCVVNFKKN